MLWLLALFSFFLPSSIFLFHVLVISFNYFLFSVFELFLHLTVEHSLILVSNFNKSLVWHLLNFTFSYRTRPPRPPDTHAQTRCCGLTACTKHQLYKSKDLKLRNFPAYPFPKHILVQFEVFHRHYPRVFAKEPCHAPRSFTVGKWVPELESFDVRVHV